MAKFIILGSSNAVPTPTNDNTHMLAISQERTVLIDCASNPVLRLPQVGVDFERITDLILTHFHPDHVSGAPLWLMDMWLLGRKQPLEIHGLAHTLDRLEAMMNLYGWQEWPNFYPVTLHKLPEEAMTPVLECASLRIFASPVKHLIPAIGLRIEFPLAGKAVAYSCDTEPCEAVVHLAQGVDVLIHEAAGAAPGHSSAEQAAEIAHRAGAASLYLIHYPTGTGVANPDRLLSQAQARFLGPVALAEDFTTLDFED